MLLVNLWLAQTFGAQYMVFAMFGIFPDYVVSLARAMVFKTKCFTVNTE